MKARLATVVLLLMPAVAVADELPPQNQARVLSKVVTYVQNFWPADGSAKVLVVHAPGPRPGREVSVFMSDLEKAELPADKKLTIVPVAWSNAADLSAKLKAEQPRAVYLGADLDEAAAREALAVLGRSGTMSVAGRSTFVQLGSLLGFITAEGRPKLLVNRSTARALGLELHPKLLALAQVVE